MMLSQNESITNDPRFQNSSGIFDFGLFVNFLAQLEIENPAAFQDWKIQEESLVAIAKENIYFSFSDLYKEGGNKVTMEKLFDKYEEVSEKFEFEATKLSRNLDVILNKEETGSL